MNKRILITNMVILNGGDGAIMQGTISALRKSFGPDTSICVFANEYIIGRQIYPEVELRKTVGVSATQVSPIWPARIARILSRFREMRYRLSVYCASEDIRFGRLLVSAEDWESILMYKDAFLIVSGGGTYLKDQYGIRSQCLDYEFSSMLCNNFALYTQSIGPISRAGNVKQLDNALKGASLVLVRDEESQRTIEAVSNIRTWQVNRFPDAAFTLANKERVEASAKVSFNGELQGLNVAISVRKWKHFDTKSVASGMESYREAIAGAVQKLLNSGANVTFISSCQGLDGYTDDSVEAWECVKLLPLSLRDRVAIREEFIRYDELLEVLSKFDICIGTRMHMCILSLCSGTLALPIAYEFKTRELFRQLGMQKFTCDIEDITSENIIDNFKELCDLDVVRRAEIFRKVLDFRTQAFFAADRIKESITVDENFNCH